MPRPAKGPRLYLRSARRRGGALSPAAWVIRDGRTEIGVGCGAGDRAGAEIALGEYLARKHQPPRRERGIGDVQIADVIAVYLADVAPGLASPDKTGERAERLLTWWGTKTLSEVTGASCRAYVAWREGKGPAVKGGKKGTGGGARRDLQDLSAAIGHHHAQGLHREIVKVPLPRKGEARQRWLTRDEMARLLWVCWRTRPDRDDPRAQKTVHPLRHLCRFLLLGLYTGSRPGAILQASWLPGPRRSHVDVDNGVFHRRPDGAPETTKRQPAVKLAPRLLAHLRRWRAADLAKGRAHVVMFDGAPVASVKTALARACALAGLPAGVTSYSLRHTCASWLVAKGLPTRLVADFLGTSEPMILKHYGHLSPDYQDRAAREVGRR